MEEQHSYQKTKTLRRAAPRYILLYLLHFGMLSINVSVAVPDRTCLSRNLFLTSDYYIGGYPYDKSTSEILTVERVLDNNTEVDDADSESWRFKFLSSEKDKFGAFTCVFSITTHGVRITTITTILLKSNGDVTPESPTVTVSVGEDVTLKMNQSFSGSSTELRWKHNGDNVTEWNGLPNVTLTNVRGSNAGIYECYRDGYYDQQRHAIMKLIVRECPAGKRGPLCSSDCPFCLNGGVCDDESGTCICTPGFSGDLCQTLNGYNHWGQDGTVQCTYKQENDPVVACRGSLMCLPDPFGCTCAAGYTSLDCRQDCPDGFFGAGCKHKCHCEGGLACDKGHGKCPNDTACAAGYMGDNCQKCPDGLFGADCRHECHCEEEKACNKENGACPEGVPCAAGYRGENCQNNCTTGKIGDNTGNCVSCLVPVHVNTPASLKNDINTLEWNQAYSRCPVNEYKVQSKLINKDQCQKVEEDFTNLTSVTARVASYDLSEADSYLHAYSTYNFRVVALNEAGLLEYPDSEIKYTTPEKAPTAPPANVRAGTIENNYLSFAWDEVPCGYRGGSNLTYHGKLTPGPGSDVLTEEVTNLKINIQNLRPCTRYLFEVAAKNVIIGELGPYSASLPVATGTKAHGPVNSLAVATDTSGSSTQMTVTWSSSDTSQNPCSLCYIVDYELTNWDQCGPVTSPQRVPVANQTNTSATITDLEAYSTYKVYVKTWNAAGYSEEREDETITPSKEPSGPPANIRPDSKTRYSISFSWNKIPCGQRNGEITAYQIQYRALEKSYIVGFMPSDTYTDTPPSSTMQYNISDLEPSTKYDIRLAGVNDVGRGSWAKIEMSTAVETELDPPAKSSYEPSKVTSTTVTISLNLPSTSPYITGVQVGVRQVPAVVKRSTSESRQIRSTDNIEPDYVAGELNKDGLPETFTVGDGKTYGGFENTRLVSGTEYNIILGSVSRISDEEYSVTWGEPLRVKVNGPDDPSSFPVVAVVVPLLFLVFLGVLAAGIIFKRRKSIQANSEERCRFNTRNSEIEIQIGNDSPEYVTENSYHSESGEETTSKPKTLSTPPPSPKKAKPESASRKKPVVTPDPVPLEEFGDYVRRKKAASYKEGNGFLKDYENLPGNIHPCSVARYEKNREKNRYANIIPYDTSRVVLDKLPDDPFSDYINACYMDGFSAPKRYIASQGPNKASTPDMWRMVWQENTAKIVMLTNLQEGIKGKCEKYWPNKSAVYGSINVWQTNEEQQADFIVRDFTIGMGSQEKLITRKVRQYHFTTWPDMGLPRDPGKVVNFINTVKEYNPKDAGPMIVHCSAGIGRTGVFIVLDSMFDQAKKEGRVDVWNFVRGMRDRRMKMIQTAAQYEFIFDTLLETFQCGDTTIKPEMLRAALAELKKNKKGIGKTGIQQQFESLNMVTSPPNAEKCRGGRDPCNVNKNRFPDKLPVDRFRPHLMTPGEEGSTDYINACFLNSFDAKGTYIATQTPMPETVGDIWRMVNDYNSSCVVMLNSWDHKDPSFGQYLPSQKKPISCGTLSVTTASTNKVENNITVHYLTLTNSKSQHSRMICHLQLLDWPTGGVPASPASVLKLVTAVQEWQSDHEGEKIVVHCIDGEDASGTFCALLNILKRLQDEKVIDVFQAVKKIRENRTGMVQTLEQYQFLYAAVLLHLDTNAVYENL